MDYIHNKLDELNIVWSEVTRIYPAVLVHAAGETASVSIEWAESKEGQVVIEAYVLVIDIDPIGEVPVNRKEIKFSSKEELFMALEILASKFS